MSSTEVTKSSTSQSPSPAVAPAQSLRRRKKTEGRKKRVLKLKTDKAFAQSYFEAKSKRATDKKSAFRKKKSKKK